MKKLEKPDKIVFLLGGIIFFIVLIVLFGGSSKRKLVGSWYTANGSTPAFVLHSDNTCELQGEYGEGRWEIVDGDVLKLTSYYGEAESANIIDVTSDHLILGSGGSTSEFWKR